MRYKAIVSYDGTMYQGFQAQKNALGIQEVIQKAFKNMTQQIIVIHSSGRTDKGVHATGQCFHFDTDLIIPEGRFVEALNRRLPEDIRVLSIKKVKKDFHARHDAVSKKYIYKLLKKPLTSFQANHYVYIPNLNYTIMREAASLFIGKHDFAGFSARVPGKPTIKTIFNVAIYESKSSFFIEFHGNSFLKYMVRSMVGTLIEIGQEKKSKEDLLANLNKPDRRLAGKTAPGKGLYLKKVYYK